MVDANTGHSERAVSGLGVPLSFWLPFHPRLLTGASAGLPGERMHPLLLRARCVAPSREVVGMRDGLAGRRAQKSVA